MSLTITMEHEPVTLYRKKYGWLCSVNIQRVKDSKDGVDLFDVRFGIFGVSIGRRATFSRSEMSELRHLLKKAIECGVRSVHASPSGMHTGWLDLSGARIRDVYEAVSYVLDRDGSHEEGPYR